MRTFAVGLMGLWATVAVAAEIQDSAHLLLEKTASVYRDASALQGEMVMVSDITMNGQALNYTNRYEIHADKQGRLRLISYSGQIETQLISDGSRLWVYRGDKKQYLEGCPPKTWQDSDADAHDDEAAACGKSMLRSIPLFMPLWSDDPYAALLDGVMSAVEENAEPSEIDACRMVSCVQKEYTWKMWINERDPSLVRRVTIHHASSNDGEQVEVSIRVDWNNQTINPVLDGREFQFTPPDGAEKVDTFRTSRRQKSEPPNGLLGKPAPEVQLPLLDGGTVDLSPHCGRAVVVLDFWASWCPPCRMALPVLKEASKRWAPSNVVFYAVNRGEDAQKVRSFVEKQPIGFPVVVDDGALAEAFGVEGIPHMVIVDQAGVVQVVHVGYTSDLGRDLDALLSRVLAGEAVAEETLKAWEAEDHTDMPEKEAAYKGKLIPSGPDAVTKKDYCDLQAEFLHKTCTEFYLNTRTNAAGEDELLRYLASYERYMAGYDDPQPPRQALVNGVRALLEKGYDHPVLHYALGMLISEETTPAAYEESTRELQAAAMQFAMPQYDFSWGRYQCAIRMLWKMRRQGANRDEKDEYARIQQDALKAFREALTDQTFSNISLRVPLGELQERMDNCAAVEIPREEITAALASVQDRIHPALYPYAESLRAYSEGWAARGGGYASTVNEENWKVFRDRVDVSRTYAEKAWEAFPCPEIAAHFIDIARCRAKYPNEWRYWFDEAVARQMDWRTAYNSLEFTIYPRWHGSHHEMLQFGEECLATHRFDTIVPSRYEVIVHDISEDSDDPLAIFRKPGVCSNLMAVFDGYLAQHAGNSAKQMDLLTRKVIAAWAAGNYSDAARHLATLGAPLASEPLNWYNAHGLTVCGEISLFNGPYSESFAEVRRLVKTGQKEKTRDALEELLKNGELDAPARYVLEDAYEALRIELALAAGETVALMPPPNLAGWCPETDQWQMREDGTLFSFGREGVFSAIRLRADLGPCFELSGDFEMKGPCYGALLIGGSTDGGGREFRLDFHRPRGTVKVIRKSNPAVEAQVPLTQLNHFLLRIEGRNMTLIVNERVLAEKFELPDDWFGDLIDPVIIGLRNPMHQEAVGIGVRNLVGRRLACP